MDHISNVMGEALPMAAIVIMVTGAGGVFGNVLVQSGVGKVLEGMLSSIGLPIMFAVFLVSLAFTLKVNNIRYLTHSEINELKG